MLWRGARWRCAWCGGRRAFFTSWFRKDDRCHTCGIDWHRGYDGFELGAATVNTIVTFGLLVAAMAVGIVATMPDIAVVPLLIGLGIGGIVVPTAAYPISYTLWQAIDLAMRPPEPGDVPAADAPPASESAPRRSGSSDR